MPFTLTILPDVEAIFDVVLLSLHILVQQIQCSHIGNSVWVQKEQ